MFTEDGNSEAVGDSKPLIANKEDYVRLIQVTNSLYNSTDFDAIATSITCGFHTLGFDRVRLYVPRKVVEGLILMSQRGMTDDILGSIWKPNAEFAARYFGETTQLHFVDGADTADVHMAEPLESGYLAQRVIIPLNINGTILAVVVADNIKTGRPIDEADLSAVSLFASQAAKALHIAKLLQETNLRVEQLESVRLTTFAIAEQHDRDQVLRTIIEQAVQLLKAKNGGLYKYFPDTRELIVITDYRRPQHVGVTLQLKEGMAGRLVNDALEGGMERFRSVLNYSESGERAPVFDKTHPYGAVLEVLLKWNGEIVGVLYVDDDAGREFSADEEQLLGLFADQAAITLANVDLVELDQMKMRGLERLSQAVGEIMTNLEGQSFEDRLTDIARHVTKILDSEVCYIALVKRKGWLSLEASYGHRENSFQRGKEFEIRTGKKTGLLGDIAFHGKIFNECGESLRRHYAVRNVGPPPHLPSGECRSLLVVPFFEKVNGTLLGLLCADNKQRADRLGSPDVKFTDTDVQMLSVFSEAVVVALESASLVGQLKQQKKQYESFVANSPAGMMAVDMEGRVTLFNERAADILGRTAEEVLGRPVEQFYADPEEPHRIAQLLHQNNGTVINYETAILHKNGDIIRIRHSSNWLYDAQGKRSGSVGYFEDMRRMELLLKSSSIIALPTPSVEELKDLVKLTASCLPHTFCRVLLRDEHKWALTVVASHGSLITASSTAMALDDWPGLWERISSGESTILENKEKEGRRTLERLSHELGLTQPIETLLVLPLLVNQKPVGMMEFGSTQPQRPFNQIEEELAKALAEKVTVLLDRMRLQELTEHGHQLHEALYDASIRIRADKDMDRLLHEIVRIAVRMARCDTGGLYVVDPIANTFELKALHGLSDSLKKSRLPDTGILARVARTGAPILVNFLEDEQSGTDHTLLELCPRAAVPLKNESGEIEAILFVGSPYNERVLGPADLDALKKLAAQASVALQTARLLTEEQRTFGKLNTLNAISDYFQATRDIEKMLHAQLTGVTAHYGLQFNRAALLLRAGPKTFVGRMAIGQLEREGWEQMVERGEYINDFQQYLEKLNRDAIEPTPLGKIISKVSFDLETCPDSVLAKAVQSRMPVPVDAGEEAIFPEEFARLFEPGTPLVVVPVEFRNEVIGLLVADNKFTRAPVSKSDVKLLVAFTYTAAIAYDKARHISELQMLNRAAHSMAQPFSRFNEGISPVGDVLQTIVDQLRYILSCDSATIWSYDSDDQKFIPEELRASGLSKERLKVFRSLEPWRQGTTYRVIEERWLAVADIDDPSYDFIRPEMREHLRGSGVRAFQGIALVVGNETVGVLYSSYREPRQFSDEDRRALENFATYAALSLKNAKLLDQLILVKRAAQAIAEVSALGDYENTLNSIATGTMEAIGCGAVVLYAFDPISEKWKYPPTHAGVRFPKAAWPNDVVPEDSIVNQILRLDGLYIADHVSDHKLFQGRRFARDEEIESCVAVPLLASGTRLGVMFVNFHKRTRFSSHQLANIALFGHQAAVAIRNAQLFDRRAKTLKKQHDLLKMSEELLELDDEREILDRAVEIAAKALETDFCNIVLPDSEGRLFFKAGFGWERELIDKLELDKGNGSQTGYTIAEQRPVAVYDYDDRSARKFDVPSIVFERGLKSGLSVPMFSEGKVFGSMLIHTRTLRKFEEEDINLLQLIANQTAIALAGAWRLRNVRRQTARLDALYEASKELSAGFSDTPRQVLQGILDLAINALTSPDGKRPFLGIIQLYNEETNELVLESVYPPEAHPRLMQRIKEKRSLNRKIGERIGLTGLAVLEGEALLVNDVRPHPEYIVYDARTLSELAVPLRSGAKVIGVINVESDYTGAFDYEDLMALKAFSDMAVIALENAKQYAELKQTKGLVGARTALAWMGMMAGQWRHEIDGKAQSIINEVRNTRAAYTPGVPDWLERKLRSFEARAAEIKAAPTVPTLSPGDTEVINLSEFICQRLKTLWDGEHVYQAAKLKKEPDLNVSASVLISSEWLGKVLDILVQNAFDAVKWLEQDRRWISVETRLADGGIELIVSDGGRGFSAEALEQVFKQQMVRSTTDSQSKKGMGMGLLMADAIVEAYAGRLRVGETGPDGTSMVVWLPITN